MNKINSFLIKNTFEDGNIIFKGNKTLRKEVYPDLNIYHKIGTVGQMFVKETWYGYKNVVPYMKVLTITNYKPTKTNKDFLLDVFNIKITKKKQSTSEMQDSLKQWWSSRHYDKLEIN